jgi:hypothetical protein
MSRLQRWETVYVRREDGEYSVALPAVGVHEPLAISATPHEPAVAAARNPGEYTNRLPVGEYTERLPVGEHTQLLREPAPEAEFKAAGLMGADLPDPPMFREVKDQLDPWADLPDDDKPGVDFVEYERRVEVLLMGFDQAKAQLFTDFAATWPINRRQVTAS